MSARREPRRAPRERDAVDEACIALRQQGYSLGRIVETLALRFGRRFTKQGIHYRLTMLGMAKAPLVPLKRVASAPRLPFLPPDGFVWLRLARAALGLSLSEMNRRIGAGQLEARFVGQQRVVSIVDLKRIWPARWARASASREGRGARTPHRTAGNAVPPPGGDPGQGAAAGRTSMGDDPPEAPER